jgi:hypothetical protein
VLERVATLEEIERHWSIDDLQKANFALDAWHAAEAEARRKK